MKKNILVIHGFNSGPGQKAKDLEKAFSKFNVVSPQLSDDPKKAISALKEIVNSLEGETHIVGTSLGAFYGMYLSSQFDERDNLFYYHINPSWKPHTTLFKLKIESFLDYCSDEEKEKFSFSLRQIKAHILFSYDKILNNSTFFFGKNDEVLNFDELKERLYEINKPVDIIETDQNHRHQDLSEVINKIKHNLEIRI